MAATKRVLEIWMRCARNPLATGAHFMLHGRRSSSVQRLSVAGGEPPCISPSAEFFAKDLPIPYQGFTCVRKNNRHHAEKSDRGGRGIHVCGFMRSWAFGGNFLAMRTVTVINVELYYIYFSSIENMAAVISVTTEEALSETLPQIQARQRRGCFVCFVA